MKHIILVVDDDPFVLNTIKENLDSWQVELYSATDPDRAKQILETVTPDLILLDLLLTKNDGSQGILDYLKGQPRLQQVPVLVLTNLDKPELRALLLSQGVKEYLIKGSLSLDDLHKKVLSYLEP
jgi:DNA-binding response OmpR family regulator